jgi:3-hydroxybutyryl-CoA dehydrogenase
MTQQSLDKLTVIGAGVLGGQIAWHSAFRGKQVVMYDLHEESLEHCRGAHQQYAHIYMQDLGASELMIEQTRACIRYSSDLPSAVAEADIVIESVPEIPEVKTSVYQELAKYLPAHTIVATNSSTLLPHQFAEATGRPEKYCALHFASMVWAVNLAEVMAHSTTSEHTLSAVTRFAIEIGMVPIPVQKQQSGYVLNSWVVPLLQSSLALLVNGTSTPEYIDRTYMILNRGCSFGPCGLMDIIGMKTCFDVSSYWGNLNNDQQMLDNAHYIKEHFLDHGRLGLQTGEGFYTYPNPSYQVVDFLAVPNLSIVPEVVRMTLPHG